MLNHLQVKDLQYSWGLEAEALAAGIPLADLRCIAKALLSHSAAGDDSEDVWSIHRENPLAPSVRHLGELGYVRLKDDDDMLAVQLCDRGISKGFGAQWVLQSAGTCLVPRIEDRLPWDPVDDLSSFELMCLLAQEEWTWAEWVTPKQRRAGRAYPALAYTPHSPKVWCSKLLPHPSYLRTLLMSEVLGCGVWS